MYRTELIIDFVELKRTVHINALLDHVGIVDKANFKRGHFNVSQVNVTLEEPNVIKRPIFQHTRK